jgi:hypothetical protein
MSSDFITFQYILYIKKLINNEIFCLSSKNEVPKFDHSDFKAMLRL